MPSFRLRAALLAATSLALTGALPAAPTASAPAPATRPNIVLIVADDLGYGDLGCYGATAIKTPNIDRLAADGRRFTRGYAPSATCTPSRYSLLTGEYAWRKPPKQTAILDADAPLPIEPGSLTLPELFRRAGYTTAMIGKWHVGLGDGRKPIDFNGEIKPGPLEVGFDQAFFIPATLDRVPCVFIDNHRVLLADPKDPIRVSYQGPVGNDPIGTEHPELLKYPADHQHAGTIINGISRIGYMSGGKAARWVDEDIGDVLVRRANAFIEHNASHPFFLYFAAHEPHVPRAPNGRFRGQSPTGIRGDAIVEFDAMVGELVKTLTRRGLMDNTLIILSSDNGPILFDGYRDGAAEQVGNHKPAGGLRGWKYLRYEGGTRVPMIALWPGHVRPGVSDQMISLVDFLATSAALLHAPLPAGVGPDSLNLLPVLLGDTKAELRDTVIEHGIGNVLAIRQGDWKYIPANADSATGIGGGADPHDARFAAAIIPEPLLFNLADDPAETKNLAATNPQKASALAALLAQIKAGKAH